MGAREQLLAAISRWAGRATSWWLVVFFLGLTGLFDRVVIFHDEIINTFKGVSGTVFDYANRPGAYGINALAVEWFGHSYFSLFLMSVLLLATATALIFAALSVTFGPFAAACAALTFLSSTLVHHYGVGAMPHLTTASAVAFCLFTILRTHEATEGRQRAYAALGGMAVVLALSTHGSMVPFVAIYAGWATLGVLAQTVGWAGGWFPLQRRSYGAFIAGLLGSLVVYDLLAWLAGGVHYFESVYLAMQRVQVDENFAKYAGAPDYYARALGEDLAVPLVVAGIALVLLIGMVRRGGGRREQVSAAARGATVAVALGALLLFVAMFLLRWKMARILIGWLPLYAASIGIVLGLARNRVRTWRGLRWGRVFSSMCIAVLVFSALSVMHGVDRKQRRRHLLDRYRYQGLVDALETTGGDRIGFIGRPPQQLLASRFALVARRDLVPLDSPEVLRDLSAAALLQHLVERDVGNVWLQIADDLDPTLVRAIRARLAAMGATRLYNWRGLHELWDTRVWLAPGALLSDALERIPDRTTIGVATGLRGLPEIATRDLLRFHDLRPTPTAVDSANDPGDDAPMYLIAAVDTPADALLAFEPIASDPDFGLGLWKRVAAQHP